MKWYWLPKLPIIALRTVNMVKISSVEMKELGAEEVIQWGREFATKLSI